MSFRYRPPQHQETGELYKVPAVYVINTVQVNGQEKYLIVSVGVGGIPAMDPRCMLGSAVPVRPRELSSLPLPEATLCPAM